MLPPEFVFFLFLSFPRFSFSLTFLFPFFILVFPDNFITAKEENQSRISRYYHLVYDNTLQSILRRRFSVYFFHFFSLLMLLFYWFFFFFPALIAAFFSCFQIVLFRIGVLFKKVSNQPKPKKNFQIRHSVARYPLRFYLPNLLSMEL